MIRPVRAAVLTPDWAPRVIPPPHEAMSPEQRERLLSENPDSFVHIASSESSSHPSGHQSAAVRAAAALERLIDEGAYTDEMGPHFFVQRIKALGRTQNSFIGAIRPEECALLPHETTHKGRVHGLAANFSQTQRMWSPVTVTCPAFEAVNDVIQETLTTKSLLSAETADGAVLELWKVPDSALAAGPTLPLEGSDRYSALPLEGSAYIIDGHHRVAAAQMAGFNQVLVAVVPTPELILGGFDRLVSDIDVMPRRTLETLATFCEVSETQNQEAAVPTRPGSFGIGIAGRWYIAERKPASDSSSTSVSDFDFIHGQLLPALFGITEPSDPRLSYRPSAQAIGLSPTPPEVFAILSAPIAVQEVFSVADLGEIMPPKTTYFVPKVRAGLMLARC